MILLQNSATSGAIGNGSEETAAAPLLPLKKGAKLALLGPHVNSTQALISIYHMDMDGIYSVLAEKSSPLMVSAPFHSCLRRMVSTRYQSTRYQSTDTFFFAGDQFTD